MSTPRSWSRGSRRQADEVGWSWKVIEMGQGTDKDRKGKKGGHTMTPSTHHLPTLSTSTHPSDNSIQTPSHSIHILSFFGQTLGTPTCVHPSPMDNILSDWAQSPFIPITTHLLTCVPSLPIHSSICQLWQLQCKQDMGLLGV